MRWDFDYEISVRRMGVLTCKTGAGNFRRGMRGLGNVGRGEDSDFADTRDIRVKILMSGEECEIAADLSPSLDADRVVLFNPAVQEFLARLGNREMGLEC